MITRLIIVGAIVALAWLLVALLERRRGGSAARVPAGLTLVTGDDCRLCPLAVAAAGRTGVRVNLVDVGDVPEQRIRSLPTALVADGNGMVLARRSGRSVISDMPVLAEMARATA